MVGVGGVDNTSQILVFPKLDMDIHGKKWVALSINPVIMMEPARPPPLHQTHTQKHTHTHTHTRFDSCHWCSPSVKLLSREVCGVSLERHRLKDRIYKIHTELTFNWL